MIRSGVISSINEASGMARVTFSNVDIVSPELPVMRLAWPLQVGDPVVCLFYPTGNQRGVILGSYYSESNPPGGE